MTSFPQGIGLKRKAFVEEKEEREMPTVAEMEKDPVALTRAYLKGDITFPGPMFRAKLFDHVKSATTQAELKRVREAMKLLPNMKWCPKIHIPTLTEKGLL